MKLPNNIKMVVSDFDGVFTDGSVYISEKMEVQKKLNFKDIMGVSLLTKAGIKFGIISGEKSSILDYFKDKFNIEDIYGGIRQKGEAMQDIMSKYKYSPDEVVYIGDDINDIPAFELVKYRIAPKNHNPILSFKVDNLIVTECFGGNGAFREVADAILYLE